MRDADAMNCVPSVEWSVANMRTRGRLMWAWGAVLGVLAPAVAVGSVGVADLWDGAATFGAARARPAGVMPSPCTFALRAYTPEKFIRPP